MKGGNTYPTPNRGILPAFDTWEKENLGAEPYLHNTMMILLPVSYRLIIAFILLLFSACTLWGQTAPDHPKVEDVLEGLFQSVEQGGQQGLSHMGIQLQEGKVLSVIEVVGGAVNIQGLVPSLIALGARVESTAPGLIKAWLPFEGLDKIADLPKVRYVRRPYAPFVEQARMETKTACTDPIVSEAISALGSTLFHSANLLGYGIRVAVIDVGFASLSYAEAAGELPAEIIAEIKDYTSEGGQPATAHGTAIAEIVHDMAPKAVLYLMKIGDEVDLANAVADCIAQDVDIVVHSAAWFNTNFGDGTGVVAKTVDRAIEAGILWVNAAGNMAQQHWLGPCRDTNRNGWVEFMDGSEALQVKVAESNDIQVFLTWDDWPAATQDLDLFLLDSTGNVLSVSQNRQAGNETPTEDIDYPATPGLYYLKIRILNASRPVALEIYSINHPLEPAVPMSSIPAPGNVEGVLTVGALNFSQWEAGPPERFSSQGPTNDGRPKPDITGPDGVTTFIYENFLGTSAAAPHVAGAAALVLARERATNMNTTIGGETLKRILIDDAIDMGPKGMDLLYGAGRCQLILKYVTAKRLLDTLFVGNQVVAGGTFTVDITARMPASLLGGIKLEEQLPDNFVAQPVENGGTAPVTNNKGKIVWYWPIVERGEERHVTYRVHVPASVPAGIYTLTGVVNGYELQEKDEITVIPPPTVPEIIAHFRPDIGKIDMRLDNNVTFQQLEQALEWWVDGDTPPCASTPISLKEIETVLSSYLTDSAAQETEIQPIHKVDKLEMDYSLSPFELAVGGQIKVDLAIRATEQLFGLGVKQDLPAKWSISPIDDDGALFRVSTDPAGRQSAQWLWIEKLERGAVKRIRFKLNVPNEGEPTTCFWLKATATSCSPSFVQDTTKRCVTITEPTITGSLQLAESYSLSSSAGGIVFHARGSNIEEIRVHVYSLNGLLLFDSGWQIGIDFQWGLYDQEGRIVPNGVYLYRLSVRGAGDTKMGSIRTFLVLR